MKLTEIKEALDRLDSVTFLTPDGEPVPEHFHVTEVGSINKRYIDCGGKFREEALVSFQLWVADDYDHRLSTEKLKKIIELSEKKLGIDPDLEVEVEYQGDTIGKYTLEFDGAAFVLKPTRTDCLAKESCGITPAFNPVAPGRIDFSAAKGSGCTPGSGCC